MIPTILMAVAVFAIVLIAMSVGVLMGKSTIKGSCGGLNNFKDRQGNSVCDACTAPSPDCAGERAKDPATRREVESKLTP
ncbi:MAG: hypothetical protein WD045_14825 [Pirellulaceae bacterium]